MLDIVSCIYNQLAISLCIQSWEYSIYYNRKDIKQQLNYA